MTTAPEPLASFEDFLRIDIRVGRVLRAEVFAKARQPSYRLWIDFGELGVKQSSAQITRFYAPEELPGTLVLAVVNFPPRNIAGFVSEVLVLGADAPLPGRGEESGVTLLRPEHGARPGQRVY